MQTKKCIQCGKIFPKPLSCSKKDWDETRKFCSTECHNDFRLGKTVYNSGQFKKGDIAINPFKKGNTPWNKDTKGVMKVNSGSFKEGQFANEKHWKWKGGIYPEKQKVHVWVVKHRGKASEHKCEYCDKQALDWSNKNHSYLYVLDDYQSLCRKCHIRYDIENNGYNNHPRKKNGRWKKVPIN